MIEDRKAPIVHLSDDLIAKCKDWAAKIAARYGSGDVLHAMPWTRDQMTPEGMREWVASRKEAGRQIDVETCELGRWHAYDADPYGADPDLPEEMRQLGTNRFVRSPESRGWVCEDDLPPDKVTAMYDRIRREYAEHVRNNKVEP
jgi:hypothetical protein